MKKYVAGLMFSKDKNSVALIVKNKPKWQKGLLNGIGGKIKEIDLYPFKNKSVATSNSLASFNAMCREFKEESSVETYPKDWSLFLTMKSTNGNSDSGERGQQYDEEWSVDFYRSFTDDVFNCKTTEDEEIKILTISEAICSATIDNLKWIIFLALDVNTIITKVDY